jgi:H+/gluconate symporter-like permease
MFDMAAHTAVPVASRGVEHPLIAMLIVAVFAALVTALSDSPTVGTAARVFLVAVAFVVTLMGLGAVFGKTLGDFLRNVHG